MCQAASVQHGFTSVKSLFGASLQYEIPPYQREYQWSSEQWQALWRDVGTMYLRELSGSPFPPHFMGILLLEPVKAPNFNSPTRYSVIDGQQRLTTLLILQAALRDAMHELEGKPVALHHGLAWVRDSNNEVEGPRLLAQESDQEALAAATNGGWRSWYAKRSSQAKLALDPTLQAYTYFRLQMWRGTSSFASEDDVLPHYRAAQVKAGLTAEEVWGASEYAKASRDERIELSTLVELMDKLALLELRIDSTDEDAPTIFESINAKRTELQQWDFIRNLIFTRFPASRASQIFDDAWKEVQTELDRVSWDGKRANSRDSFVYDYVIARGEQSAQGSISKNRGYQHLRTRMTRLLPERSDPTHLDELEAFVRDDLLSAARCWPVAVGERATPIGGKRSISLDAAQLIESIAKLSSGPPFPAVLHFVEGWNNEHLSDEELVDALTLIETLLVRLVLAKRALSPLRSLFMQLMNKTWSTYDTAVLRSSMRALRTGDATALPTDDELFHKLRTEDYYNAGLTGGQLGAVFRGIERQMAGGAAHPLPYGKNEDDFSVEHVFPQSCLAPPHGAWSGDFASWGVVAEEMAQRLHRLGNLTLLTLAANRIAKARAFDFKRAVVANQSNECPHPMLSISQAIIAAEEWTPHVIDQRTDLLARRILERWPFA